MQTSMAGPIWGTPGGEYVAGRSRPRGQPCRSTACCDFFSSPSAARGSRRERRIRLGATWDGRGTNFALFSANATKVELCLFDSQGRRELERIALPGAARTSGRLPQRRPPGPALWLRVRGPMSPERAFASIAQASARSVRQESSPAAGLERCAFGYRTGSPRGDLSFDRRDNARGMPKGVVIVRPLPGGRSAGRIPMGRHHHLRSARPKVDAAARGLATRHAGHVRG